MKTTEEKLLDKVDDVVLDVKEQLFKEFCQAHNREVQDEIRNQVNVLAKLTFKLKSTIKKGN